MQPTANLLEQESSAPVPRATLHGYPKHWEALSFRTIASAQGTQAFEFADGLVWSIPKVEPGDQVFRFDDIYGDAIAEKNGAETRVTFWLGSTQVAELTEPPPTLAQFILLVTHLTRENSVKPLILPDELYWIRNTKGRTGHLVNVRSPSAMAPDDNLLRFVKPVVTRLIGPAKSPLLVSVYAATSRHATGILIGCRSTDALKEYVLRQGPVQ